MALVLDHVWQSADGSWSAHNRCCEFCQTQNAGSLWGVRPDGMTATSRQCKQFQIFERDGETGTYSCTSTTTTSAMGSRPTYPGGDAGTYHLYSTIPFSQGTASPNAPPSPARRRHSPVPRCRRASATRTWPTARASPRCASSTTRPSARRQQPALRRRDRQRRHAAGNHDPSIADNDPYAATKCYKVPMAGYIPDDGVNRPAYMHHVGTTEDCTLLVAALPRRHARPRVRAATRLPAHGAARVQRRLV